MQVLKHKNQYRCYFHNKVLSQNEDCRYELSNWKYAKNTCFAHVEAPVINFTQVAFFCSRENQISVIALYAEMMYAKPYLMKYELVKLENIFSSQFNDRQKDMQQDQQQREAGEFESEAGRIESVFLGMLFSSVSDSMRKRYIRHHQQRLQFLCEKLYRYMETNKLWLMNADALLNYQRLLNKVEHLLNVIELHFPADMLMDSIAPTQYNNNVTEEVRSGLPFMEDKLRELRIQKELFDLLTDSFELFVNRRGYQLCCYGQVNMMRDILQAILQYEPLDAIRNSNGGDKWLIELLCRYNFNRLPFYKFCRSWILKYFSGELDDRLYLYTRCGKFFSRLAVHKTYGWNLQRMPINDMVTDYFRDKFLSEKRKIQQELLSHHAENGAGFQNGKLSVNLTADQLGLFIRLLNEVEMIKNSSVAGIVRFFTQHFSTVGKDPTKELSYDYLKITYGKTSIPAIEKIDTHLQSMVKLLHKIRIETRQTQKGKP